MKTDREVLQYVYDRMVSNHLEPTSAWYMLELNRIIEGLVVPPVHTDLDRLRLRVERIERSMPAYTPLRGMVDEIRGDMMNFADRIGSLELNVGDHERQLGVLNRVVTAGWAEGERPGPVKEMHGGKEPWPGEKGAGDDYPVQDYGHDKVSPV